MSKVNTTIDPQAELTLIRHHVQAPPQCTTAQAVDIAIATLSNELARVQRHLIALHISGVLSEGQAGQMTGLDRVTVREIADTLLNDKAPTEGDSR